MSDIISWGTRLLPGCYFKSAPHVAHTDHERISVSEKVLIHDVTCETHKRKIESLGKKDVKRAAELERILKQPLLFGNHEQV